MVLLDSEGIDAVSGEGSDDHCIFTLTILLASVLIYNSAGVPTRTDLDGLEYPYLINSRGEDSHINVTGRRKFCEEPSLRSWR